MSNYDVRMTMPPAPKQKSEKKVTAKKEKTEKKTK